MPRPRFAPGSALARPTPPHTVSSPGSRGTGARRLSRATPLRAGVVQDGVASAGTEDLPVAELWDSSSTINHESSPSTATLDLSTIARQFHNTTINHLVIQKLFKYRHVGCGACSSASRSACGGARSSARISAHSSTSSSACSNAGSSVGSRASSSAGSSWATRRHSIYRLLLRGSNVRVYMYAESLHMPPPLVLRAAVALAVALAV